MGAAATPLPVPRQIIDGDGVFDIAGLNRFVKDSRLADCGVSYTVVSIMGPQSSGKSTLLNHLFRTSFREMNSDEGRSQTTNGIWLAKAAGIQPCTLVMDLEGNDGRERGEDDTSFERQSALFALAVSDVVLINMWCHDIGREQASNKPLLRTVFQVMARLFTPRKITLLFVIRDKTRSPLEKLESTLRHDIRKIWDSVASSGARQGAALSEFFDLQVVALPNFEEKEEQFTEEVAGLRERFSYSSTPGGLVQDRGAKVHASGFSFNAKQIWNLIKEEKDLDLPSISVMVSTIRCAEIAQEKFNSFHENKDWLRLEDAVSSGPMPDFHRQLTSIIDACLSGFSEETIDFDENVRTSKRTELEEKLLNFVEPAFQSFLGHLRTQNLVLFKESFAKALDGGEGFSDLAFNWTKHYLARFDELSAGAVVKQAKWDTSSVRENLRRDMDAHVASLQAEKLSELTEAQKKKLDDALAGRVESIFEDADDKTWSSIRGILRQETERAVSGFSAMISGFEIAEQTKKEMLAVLQDHAKGVIEVKVAQLAKRALMLMKAKFSRLFLYDGNSNMRTWTEGEDIQTLYNEACSASMNVLSALSEVRLYDEADGAEIARSRILIIRSQCESICKQFTEEVQCMLNHAVTTQEAHRGGDGWVSAAMERITAIASMVWSIIKPLWDIFFFYLEEADYS